MSNTLAAKSELLPTVSCKNLLRGSMGVSCWSSAAFLRLIKAAEDAESKILVQVLSEASCQAPWQRRSTAVRNGTICEWSWSCTPRVSWCSLLTSDLVKGWRKLTKSWVKHGQTTEQQAVTVVTCDLEHDMLCVRSTPLGCRLSWTFRCDVAVRVAVCSWVLCYQSNFIIFQLF